MQVIFVKDLRKQGKKGEIKTVADGYAKNFLIKNGYAIPVNERNMNNLQHERLKEENPVQEKKKDATKEKKKLEAEKIEFQVKTGKDDKVFGSISPKQIKEDLDKRGYKIDKKQIELENSITSLGYHDVKINLYSDIYATIKIHVVK